MGAGGAERQVAYLAKGFVDEGHDVDIVLLKRGENFLRLKESGARVHFLTEDASALVIIYQLAKLFRKINPCVAYIWQRPFDVCGGLAAFMARIPCVHAERTDPAKVSNGLKKTARRILVKQSRGVVANSKAGANYWIRNGVKEDRVTIIPNAIPFEELSTVEASRESHGCFVSVGRLDYNKNVLSIVKAIDRLRSLGETVQLRIVGTGPNAATIADYISKAGLGDQILMLGFRTDVWSLMKGSKGLVSLSYVEGEPNVVLEASALGCRLLLSDIPPHRQAETAVNTLFVNPNSIEQIGIALMSLNRENCDSVSSHKMSNRRSVGNICRAHIEFFEQSGIPRSI